MSLHLVSDHKYFTEKYGFIYTDILYSFEKIQKNILVFLLQ